MRENEKKWAKLITSEDEHANVDIVLQSQYNRLDVEQVSQK